ncbi:MAG TPA: Hsp20/alpha crystallin family protein [Coleofasciculaceae cyanobacterium]|jgi:HSP20 family protein
MNSSKEGNSHMALIRWQPFQEVETLRRQMDQMFDDLTGWNRDYQIAWKPAIEVQDTDDNVVLRAEIPGIEGKDLDIRVTREAVAITGEHRYEKKTDEKGFFRSEFRYGKFQRVIPLPVPVQNDQVKADFTNGILTLTLPKVETAKNRVVKLNLAEPVAVIEESTEQPVNTEANVSDEQPVNTETNDVWESQKAEPAAV